MEIQSRDVGVFSAGFDLFGSAAEAWGDWCDVWVLPLEISWLKVEENVRNL